MAIVKDIFKERGIKDVDRDLVRKAWENELVKVQRKWNITKIIHDTYVKEIARFFQKKADDERKKREESEERKKSEEAKRLEDIAAAEEERKR